MLTVRTHLWKVLVAVLAALAAAFATVTPAGATTGPAPPKPGASISVYGYYYGAIALAMTGGAVGWSYDYSTKRQALREAKYECQSASDYPWTCKKIAWVRNGCLAIAVQWDGDYISYYGWGVARTKRQAYWRALDECGYGCVKRAWTCTRR